MDLHVYKNYAKTKKKIFFKSRFLMKRNKTIKLEFTTVNKKIKHVYIIRVDEIFKKKKKTTKSLGPYNMIINKN